jgi:hypothetical protein
MNRAKRIFSCLIVGGSMLTVAASQARAESGIPDPTTFFAGLVNPAAKGKKVSGFLTIAYDFTEDFDTCTGVKINNMFVVTTLSYRRALKPFNRDFTAPDGTELQAPFCFDQLNLQIDFVMGLFRDEVIPHFFKCTARVDCPAFEVKALKSFLSSGTGAVSAEVQLAVQVPGRAGAEDDD